jgi:hypothetical protein
MAYRATVVSACGRWESYAAGCSTGRVDMRNAGGTAVALAAGVALLMAAGGAFGGTG